MKVDSDNYTLADFLQSENGDIFAKAKAFSDFLSDWKDKGTYSYHRLVTSACTTGTTIRDRATNHEKAMIVLASNNYLGLNMRPEIILAAQNAAAQYGTGMCGSRFLSGTYDLIEELERQLAEFESCEDAMVFTSGYQANVGTISALMRPKDMAFIDRLCHASIVDGCRLAGCKFRTFKHNDMNSLSNLLAKSDGKCKGKLIIAEGVFSMDGDTAPLPEITKLAEKYGAKVMVDEAHATGVLGPNGRGTVEHFDLHGKIDVILGTFSKTLSATGGFIAASREVINYVRHYGRSYMFSASPTPSVVATVLTALHIVRREPWLRKQLWDNIKYLHRELKGCGFSISPDPAESAIITILVGSDTTVRRMSKKIYEKGLFTNTVAYPAVPQNQGKIRLSVSAIHTHDQLDKAVEILSTAGKEYGIV
ncbi:aminotransferase class I/II-fold pyridoxal phosphate-dependent enzyme [Verrucomicrobiota bacterium]